jgi:hypothetical protein
MPWGDDWAGYLMQARALASGTIDAELATNTLAMQACDVQIGPYAYPWGYPALLAGAGLAAGWSLPALKAIGGASIVLLVICTYTLARRNLGLGLAIFVTLAVAFQPDVLVDAAHLGSDVPFLAMSSLSLLLIVLQYERAASGQRWNGWFALAVALTAAAAFSLRSNGAVLACTYGAMLGLAALRGERPWAETIVHGLVFAVVMAGILGVYFLTLPDGSLVHANFFSTDPAVWARRLLAHLHAIANWVTLNRLPGVAKLVPLGVMLGLLAWGVVRRPKLAAILLVYLALHLALLTVFPFDGGQRYYHPLLPAAFLLVGFGLQAGLERLARVAGPDWRGPRALASGALALLLIAGGLVAETRLRQAGLVDPGIDAPYAPATEEVMGYVKAHAPPGARIAFFKPRTFRALTGRVASAISEPRNLDRVDWYVFNAGTTDTRTQIPEPALQGSPLFRLVHEQAPFRVYVRCTGPTECDDGSHGRAAVAPDAQATALSPIPSFLERSP